MSRRTGWHDFGMRARLLLVLVAVSLATAAVAAQSASATITPSLKTFKVEVDVDLTFYEKVTWKGIVPGCFNPAENFTIPYYVEMDSTPRKGQKAKPGTATLMSTIAGVTPSYGAPGGFRQESRGASWELQVKNPSPCDTEPPPSWASSPTCKKISERVSAQLQMEADSRDGRVVIMRTPKARSGAMGAKVGESCLRTLVNPTPRTLASEIAISQRTTFVNIPVRSLRSKLEAMTEFPDSARPEFNLRVKFGGDCTGMTVTGSIGDDPDWSRRAFTKSEFWLGPGPGTSASCELGGSGWVRVARVGKVVETGLKVQR